MSWMLFSRNELKVFHRKKGNDPSNMRLTASLINIECHTYGIFEVISHHQEDEYIAPSTFVTSVGLIKIIKKLVSSNFMVMVSSVSVIFDNGYIYSCSTNKGGFVKIDEKILPRNLKVIAKVLEVSRFGIVEYSCRNKIGHMIALWYQAYYVSGLPKGL